MDLGNNHLGLPSPKWPEVRSHEVFLSFRGADVRKSFIGFLYNCLVDSDIDAFIDHKGIDYGEDIMPKILQVIRHTEICIPVFSKDFASSKCCLTEVVEMVERNRTVMPIFYDVSPSVVGKQEGSYRDSFCNHAAEGVESATINKWKEALQSVSRKRGCELEKFHRGEYELIKEVVAAVRRLLRKDDLPVSAQLVGMDHPVQEVMKKLGVRCKNGEVIKEQNLKGIRMVEISGLPGIGKSTLARVIFNKIHHLFEGKSFLKEVEQRSLLTLQEDLVSGLLNRTYTFKSPAQGAKFIEHKLKTLKALLVFDHVSDFKQINSLAGDLSWFGPGSRIIVISMRSNLVDEYNEVPVPATSSSNVHGCNDILVRKYVLERMKDDHAFQLFCRCARIETHQENFSSLARDIVLAVEGIPLLIEVVGSFLSGKAVQFWVEALDRLRREPFDEKVKQILKSGYNELDKYAKEIYLDIACFFAGKDWTIPRYMWEACQYYPYRGIYELHNMSLVKTRENNELCMHHQLEVLGRDIVKEKHPKRPLKWSRLWNQADIEEVASQEGKVNLEAKVAAVEALSATFDESGSFPQNIYFGYFSNLRYLKMEGALVQGCEQRRKKFLRRLKWLEWQRCDNPYTLLALDLSELVILDLSRSISISWECWTKIMEKAKNLKVLILKYCAWLAKSPVTDALVNLERLNLEHCSTLPGVGRSISKLRNLVSLNIKFCSFVRELPEDIGSLEALKELYIDGTDIKAIPEGSYQKLEILSACNCKSLSLTDSIGNLKSLVYLALDDNELSKLPYSIGSLENLQTLSLRNCRPPLFVLPDSIGNLQELQVMDLSDTRVDELPSSVKDLRNLKVLKMARTCIREFPGGIENLESLEEIDFSDCKCLTGKCDITGLSSLRVLLLGDTDISQVIGTDVQCSYFPDLRLDGRFCNWRDGTSKGAQHWINECEPTSWFETDERPINMSLMSEGP